MKVISTMRWSEEFFRPFIDYRNNIHKDIAVSFPESLDDYKKFFAPDSAFAGDYIWEAFQVIGEDGIKAKAVLSWRKNEEKGSIGFIDWDNNEEAAEVLMDAVSASAKREGLKFLKSPIDLNFYIKYRIRLPGGGEPFWGEPIYPDYYHDLFRHTGFSVAGEWDTYRMNRLQGIKEYLDKRRKLAKKKSGSHFQARDKLQRTEARCIRMNDWDSELRIIHELFVEAYKSMPEWESITFEQFKVIYDDFKYIINPLYSYIVELRGKPVGFSINFADPLPILLKVKGRKLGAFDKALLLLKLRLNTSCFLIAHVGKIPGPDGEEIKGVQIQVSKRIQFITAVMRKVLVTFQMTNSPSRRSFEGKALSSYAKYVIYGKRL